MSSESLIKKFALCIGFDRAGITKADGPQEAIHLDSWIAKGFHGDMSYMSKDPLKRASAKEKYSWAKSVICVLKNYFMDVDQLEGKISIYALSRDYHLTLKENLWRLCSYIKENFGAHAVPCVDTSPVLERPYAKAAGLGWIGKNSNLINKSMGSFFFLGEVITDLKLEPDEPYKRNYCGSCTRCIDLCPTGAIVSPYVIDSNRCISYLTIEYKGVIPRKLRPLIGDLIFGCDICQDVCPWNKFAKTSADLKPMVDTNRKLDDYMCISNEEFRTIFRHTAIKRAGRDGFLRNVAIALGNTRSMKKVPALVRGLEDESWLVRLHSAWGLYNISPGNAAILRPYLVREQDERVREEMLLCCDDVKMGVE